MITIPKENLFYPERVGSKVITVKNWNPSIPNKSTIVVKQTNHIAATQYLMTMQSRDASDKILDSKTDVYSV